MNTRSAKIIESFKTIACDIISKMTSLQTRFIRSYSKRDSPYCYDCSIIIEITGEYKGVVSLNMKKETACEITSAMTGKRYKKDLDTFAESALKELANMAIGQSLSKVTDKGEIEITSPSLVYGKNTLHTGKIDVITLDTSKGIIEIHISLL